MAVKKTISTPTAIADKVVEDLGANILKIVKSQVKEAVGYAMEEGLTGYCWDDDLADSDLGYEIRKLISEYLEEHIVAETKFILVE